MQHSGDALGGGGEHRPRMSFAGHERGDRGERLLLARVHHQALIVGLAAFAHRVLGVGQSPLRVAQLGEIGDRDEVRGAAAVGLGGRAAGRGHAPHRLVVADDAELAGQAIAPQHFKPRRLDGFAIVGVHPPLPGGVRRAPADQLAPALVAERRAPVGAASEDCDAGGVAERGQPSLRSLGLGGAGDDSAIGDVADHRLAPGGAELLGRRSHVHIPSFVGSSRPESIPETT